MNHKFQCGAAKADITPEAGLLPSLFGLMAVPYAGVLDPLALRVLALSDGEEKALVISFDLDKAPNPIAWLPLLVERTGIPEECITYLATHTHSAPVTTYRPKETPRRPVPEAMRKAMEAYEETVKEKLLACVDEALASLRPARMGYGRGESFINTNRNAEFFYEQPDGTLCGYTSQGPNGGAPVDRTVFVMKLEAEDGTPIAFFINYAVHCCTMFLNHYNDEGHMGISGDIAGAVSRWMEEKFPGSVAIWSSGAAGDVNPIIANEVFYPDPKDGARKTYLVSDWAVIHALMNSLAAQHFADILSVVRGITELSPCVRIGGALEWSETPALEVSPGEAGGFVAGGERQEPYRIRLHLLRLGDVALLGVGGELYSSFGRLIREHAPLSNTVILNHDASLVDDAGYILDDETLGRVRRETPVRGMVPGGGSASKAGCVGPSLLTHTAALFRKVL